MRERVGGGGGGLNRFYEYSTIALVFYSRKTTQLFKTETSSVSNQNKLQKQGDFILFRVFFFFFFFFFVVVFFIISNVSDFTQSSSPVVDEKAMINY